MNHQLDLQCIKVLSKTELRIFELLADGLQNSEIADKLIVSVHTIKNHKANMFRKLELKNVHELYCIAIKYAIVLHIGGGKKLVNFPIDFGFRLYLNLHYLNSLHVIVCQFQYYKKIKILSNYQESTFSMFT